MRLLPISVLALLVLVTGSACTGNEPPVTASESASGAGGNAAGQRPIACTAEIVNSYYNNKRFTGPGDSFDAEATIVVVAELLEPACAKRPMECVEAVIEAVNATTVESRERATATYRATPACVDG